MTELEIERRENQHLRERIDVLANDLLMERLFTWQDWSLIANALRDKMLDHGQNGTVRDHDLFMRYSRLAGMAHAKSIEAYKKAHPLYGLNID